MESPKHPYVTCPQCMGRGKICAGAYSGCDNNPRQCTEKNNCGEYEITTCKTCDGAGWVEREEV